MSRISGETLLLAVCAAAAAVFVGVFGLRSRHALYFEAVPALLVPLALWLFFSARYEVTLAVLLLYLGLFDGVLKLQSASTLATLGRDVLLYVIALGALTRALLLKQPLLRPPLMLGVLAWVAACLMQLANPADLSLLHAVAALRQHLEFVPLFFLGYMVLRSDRRLAGFFMLLVVVAAVNGVVSLTQWQLTPHQLASWGPGYAKLISGTAHLSARGFVAGGISHVRPPALGSDMGFGGVLGTLALPGLIVLITDRQWRVKLGWLLVPASGLVILAIWTSQSRTVVVSAVVGVIVFLALTLTTRRGLTALIATVLVAVTAYAAIGLLSGSSLSGKRYDSIAPTRVIGTTVSYRKTTFALIPSYLVGYPLGAGLGSTGPASGVSVGGTVKNNRLNAESEFTFLLTETGIPGLSVMLALTVATFGVGVRLRRLARIPLQRQLMALTAGLAALMVMWLVGTTTTSSPTAPFFWCASGAIVYWYGEWRAGRLAVRSRIIAHALSR